MSELVNDQPPLVLPDWAAQEVYNVWRNDFTRREFPLPTVQDYRGIHLARGPRQSVAGLNIENDVFLDLVVNKVLTVDALEKRLFDQSPERQPLEFPNSHKDEDYLGKALLQWKIDYQWFDAYFKPTLVPNE